MDDEAALDLILPGIVLYDEYRWEYRAMATEALVAAGLEPTEENIEYISLKAFISNYLLSQIQDPESVKPSVGGFIDFVRTSKNPFINSFLGRPVRLVDTAINGAVGLYKAVEGAGKAIGNYAWTMTTSTNALVDFVQGDISRDEFNTQIAEDDKIRRSITIGHYSGYVDAVVGAVGGTLGSLEYIGNGSTFLLDGTSALISAKDDAIVDAFDLSREDYMQGKCIATVEIVIVTLAIMLGKSMANTAAKNAYNSAKTPRTGADWNEYFKSKYGSENVKWVNESKYTIKEAAMTPHKTGSTTSGKSQFLYDIDAEKAVWDAASYADSNSLWIGNKTKVPVINGPVGVTGSGELTNYINVYRTNTGLVHGCPGNPQ